MNQAFLAQLAAQIQKIPESAPAKIDPANRRKVGKARPAGSKIIRAIARGSFSRCHLGINPDAKAHKSNPRRKAA